MIIVDSPVAHGQGCQKEAAAAELRRLLGVCATPTTAINVHPHTKIISIGPLAAARDVISDEHTRRITDHYHGYTKSNKYMSIVVWAKPLSSLQTD